jgi:ethanolamine ammonia-lyase large subunit
MLLIILHSSTTSIKKNKKGTYFGFVIDAVLGKNKALASFLVTLCYVSEKKTIIIAN